MPCNPTPRAPAAPNRPLLLIAVLIVGIGAGIAAAFGMGQLRSTFTTSAKLERITGLPVLGAISETLTDSARAANNRRTKQFYMASGALGGIFVLLLVAEFIQVSMVA